MVQLLQLAVGSYLWLGLGFWASLPPIGLALPEVVFRCPPCTADRLAACPLPRPGTAACQEVQEPGCGCCSVCARFEGEPCGVYTPRCAPGFRCYPSPGSDLPLQALVQGQGTCGREFGVATVEHHREDNEDLPEVVEILSTTREGWIKSPGKSGKEQAIWREKANEQQKQMVKLLKPEPRLQPLRTPCQQELDQVLERISTMRLPDERGPLEHLYSLNIPNCDKQGHYNLKQCKMSVNGQRGECWCVNPITGKTIQGSPTIRGDPECHLFYSGLEQEDRGAPALHVQ